MWWEQEYLMPVLLTNILDCEIMALGCFLSAPSTKLLDFQCLVGLNILSTILTSTLQFLTSTLLQTQQCLLYSLLDGSKSYLKARAL